MIIVSHEANIVDGNGVTLTLRYYGNENIIVKKVSDGNETTILMPRIFMEAFLEMIK